MIMFIVFMLLIISLYVASASLSMDYFICHKKYKGLRLIFYVASVCPVWNSYFAIKNLKECNLIPSGKEIFGWIRHQFSFKEDT